MSRAFVKEPDGDAVVDDAPDLPQSPHPNYVTPKGLAQLQAQREALITERDAVRAQSDDIANRLPLGHLGRELRHVEGRLERAILVDPTKQLADEVAFGAIVEVEDDSGERREVAIVGEDEADVDAGRVSWISPLARALMGSGVGDYVTWKRPVGDLGLEILSIRYTN
jgi:transcription elongation factor GreB